MYSAFGYYDSNQLSADTMEKMPYRKRNKMKDRSNAQEKWKEACLSVNPDFDNLPEAAKEVIESKLKVEYYIALGADTSLPKTVTSGSIQTPRVSPLVRRPPRVPSRAPSAPEVAIPARPVAPIGPLPPLPLLPSLAIPPPVSPIPSIPALQTLAPIQPFPPLVPNNPYLTPFYQPEDKNAVASTSTATLAEGFYPISKPDRPRYYDPSISAFSATKLAQSSSAYVDYPSIYDCREDFYSTATNNNDSNNNNNTSTWQPGNNNNNNISNNNNNNNNDEPFDYTFEALNQWNF
ncbi:putative mediator of RNA polymerase II transcription subunit 26 [Amyelois transitella]|uniref:putative mediator of RNA polymerase II transcription subunit 26 n=1 Tax=Amyelois transitella TaxID=680683 RepID=UPI00067DCDB4|nr:putative mediator of RNA polymerase II transcription subunit 26 [Amyelois transitella]